MAMWNRRVYATEMVDIAFIIDGGPEVGLGHVYESITLAKEIKDVSEIKMISLSDRDEVVSKLEEHGFHPSVVERSELTDQLVKLDLSSVLIHLPWIGEDLVRQVKSSLDSRIVLYGDPSTNLSLEAIKHSNVVVSSNKIEDGFGGEKKTDEYGTLHLVGPRYFIPRPSFYQYSGSYQTESLEKILIMFGASDPSNLTSFFLDEILSLDANYDIDVVVGAGFQYCDEMKGILNTHNRNHITIYKDIDNVAEIMYKSDLILTSPGLSSLEALFVGVPTLAVYQNERQKKAYRTAEFSYPKEKIKRVEEKIRDTYNMFTQQDEYDAEIGTGKNEIIAAILNKP